MKMKEFFVKIKRKAFATYEYNERFNSVEENIAALNRSQEALKYFLEETNNKIDSLGIINNKVDLLDVIANRISSSQSELSDATNRELNLVKDNIQIVSDKVEPLNYLPELKSSLASYKMILNLIAKNTKESIITKNKVLFLVNNINAWHAIGGIVSELSQIDEVEVIVASINKKFPGQSSYDGENEVHSFLEEKGIHHIRLGMQDSYQALDILVSISPDVIFRQSQWDPDYPPALSSENLNFTKLAIVSYGISNIIKNANYTGDIKDSAVDSLYHRRSWRTYCSSEYVKHNAISNGSMDGRQFAVVGHPKIDYLLNVKPLWPFKDRGNKKILWSPHHSITQGWSDFGMFPWVWKDMLILAETMKDIDFVFCPHPALVTQLTGNMSPIPDGEYETFITTWDSMDNCHSYYGAEYAEISSACDLIITDGISMLMECQLLNKDIVFMERFGHAEFNNIGEVLSSGFYTERSIEGIKAFIEGYFSGGIASLKDKQIANIEKLFPTRNAAINITKNILSSLRNV